MAKGNLQYTVVDGDSLVKIANKHGMPSPVESARKIWQDQKNESLHAKANMSGRTVNRQLHVGGNKYQKYDHSKFAAGYRGYDQPDQIILYTGEKIWIPDTEWIRHEITDDELINGFVPDYGKKYELVYPAYKVLVEKENLDEDADCEFTLTGKKGNEVKYQKTLNIKNNTDDKPYLEVIFQMTPRGLLYSLDCEQNGAVDKEGNKLGKYNVFTDVPYGR